MSCSRTTSSNSDLMSSSIKKFIPLLRLENIALAVLAIVIVQQVNGSLWLLAATFLLFDVSAIGYVFNPCVGAISG